MSVYIIQTLPDALEASCSMTETVPDYLKINQALQNL